MIVKAKAVKLGNNVDTDVILPGKYLAMTDPTELREHAMEGPSPGFASKFVGGAVIVAGENFGQGSSREHAAIALKAAAVKCVVAESFARIFYRNAINIGLPAVECLVVQPSSTWLLICIFSYQQIAFINNVLKIPDQHAVILQIGSKEFFCNS